jgi:hypothetical protein
MPGGVDKDHLHRRAISQFMQRDAQHPRPGGLRLGAGDRDLLADKAVHQRRFARIGRAKHGNDAAAGGGIIRHSKAFISLPCHRRAEPMFHVKHM